jgi:hypothetical protein
VCRLQTKLKQTAALHPTRPKRRPTDAQPQPAHLQPELLQPRRRRREPPNLPKRKHRQRQRRRHRGKQRGVEGIRGDVDLAREAAEAGLSQGVEEELLEALGWESVGFWLELVEVGRGWLRCVQREEMLAEQCNAMTAAHLRDRARAQQQRQVPYPVRRPRARV